MRDVINEEACDVIKDLRFVFALHELADGWQE
jgi:hypothetical protein